MDGSIYGAVGIRSGSTVYWVGGGGNVGHRNIFKVK